MTVLRASKSRSTATGGRDVVRDVAGSSACGADAAGSPMFTLTAVLSLAIGIGGTAVIFGVADAYLFRPWPGIADPIGSSRSAASTSTVRCPPPRHGFRYVLVSQLSGLPQRQTVFQSLAASRTGDAVGLGDGTAQTRGGRICHGELFLGARYAHGARPEFLTEDMEPRSRRCRHHQPSSVAVSVRWRPNVVGRTVQFNGRPFTIVGVAAAGFNGHNIDRPASGCR